MSMRDRQDSPPVHGSRSSEKPRKQRRQGEQRNYNKCNQCRKDHKSCHLDDPTSPDTTCRRCLEKRWLCSGQVRKQTNHGTPETFTQDRRVMIAARHLLRSCLRANWRLKELIYPWPCGKWGQKSKSTSLKEACGLVASRLHMQTTELNHILDRLAGYEASLESDLDRSARQIIRGNAGDILACVAHIQPEWHDNSAGGPSPSPQHYLSLAKMVRELLCTYCSGTEGLSSTGAESVVSINSGFPPCHIAYLNGDRDMALGLWWNEIQPYLLSQTQIVYADGTIDLLGRTFPQLVAEAGDFETLWKIAHWAPNVMLHANHDGRGLSLLALAICGPGELDFGFLQNLLSQRPWALSRHYGPEPGILDLALLSRNIDLVAWILGQNFACESFDGYVQKAIELGEANIALLFLPWLNEAERVSQDAVNKLARLAEKKQTKWTEMLDSDMRKDQRLVYEISCWLEGFPQLVDALRKTVVRQATAGQIVADINQVPLAR